MRKVRHTDDISIHALREESDLFPGRFGGHVEISIHALREESDPCPDKYITAAMEFQSTLSVRRAT